MEQIAQPENLEKAQVYIDFVKNNLEPLAQHLKVSVEWLWNILVMQARVEAIVYLLICLGMFATTVSLSVIFFKSIKKAKFKNGYGYGTTINVHKKTGEQTDGYLSYSERKDYHEIKIPNETNSQGYVAFFSGIALALMMLTSTITTATSLKIIVTGLVNPEFRAIEKIVEYAKPNVPAQTQNQ